jgi:hypothetical protein
MVRTATIVEQVIREAAADYVNRKRSMSTGAPPPPLPSKRQSSSSGSGSFRKRNVSMSRVSVSISQCNKCGKAHSGEFMVRSRVCYWAANQTTLPGDAPCQSREVRGHKQATISLGNLHKIEFIHSHRVM